MDMPFVPRAKTGDSHDQAASTDPRKQRAMAFLRARWRGDNDIAGDTKAYAMVRRRFWSSPLSCRSFAFAHLIRPQSRRINAKAMTSPGPGLGAGNPLFRWRFAGEGLGETHPNDTCQSPAR